MIGSCANVVGLGGKGMDHDKSCFITVASGHGILCLAQDDDLKERLGKMSWLTTTMEVLCSPD